MKIRVEGYGDFEFDSAHSIAALTLAVARERGVALGHDSHLLFIDGDRCFELPQKQTTISLASQLHEHERDALTVQLIPVERCSHGSPAVPGRGFLCGWC